MHKQSSFKLEMFLSIQTVVTFSADYVRGQPNNMVPACKHKYDVGCMPRWGAPKGTQNARLYHIGQDT